MYSLLRNNFVVPPALPVPAPMLGVVINASDLLPLALNTAS